MGQAVRSALRDLMSPTSEQLDLTDANETRSYLADHRPEIVIHLAARVGGIKANIAAPADFLLHNLILDANLLTALRANPPRHLIVMLSTCMYPDRVPESTYPMTEDMVEDGPPPTSNAAYAAAKRALWHGVRALHDQDGISYSGLIASNLYGPGDHFGSEASHFLAAAIHKIEGARRQEAPSVEFFGSGVALRQFLFVLDLARLISILVSRGALNASVNVAPAHNLPIRTLAEAVAVAAGYEGKLHFSGQGPDGQFRKDVSTKTLVHLVPEWPELETPLEVGLLQTIDWYRRHVAPR